METPKIEKFDEKFDRLAEEAKQITHEWINKRVNDELENNAKNTIRIEHITSTSPKENILKENKFENSKKLFGGCVGDATFVKIENNGNGVFKPHLDYSDNERIQFINRERATYLVSQFIGFDFVPLTVVREMLDENGVKQIGSLQEFVNDSKSGYQYEEEKISINELLKLFYLIFLLQALIGIIIIF